MLESTDFSTQDIDILEGSGRELKLRLFTPDGAEAAPFVVDLHGGAWCAGAYEECFDRDEVFAKAGVAAASLDFRDAEHGYPTSSIDINYAIRWLKAHAAELGLDPARAGVTGQSSGGHLAMLAAMRPDDARYCEIALPAGAPDVDASVLAVAMNWPVINPLSRYYNAQNEREKGTGWVGDIPERHDTYWKTEAAMEEGNPVLILERGEDVQLPPALWVQGRPDPVHDYRDPNNERDINEPDRFLENYRNAGGEIELVEIGQSNRDETSSDPQAAFFAKQFG